MLVKSFGADRQTEILLLHYKHYRLRPQRPLGAFEVRVGYPSQKQLKTFLGPIRSFTVKVTHIYSAVNEILLYRQKILLLYIIGHTFLSWIVREKILKKQITKYFLHIFCHLTLLFSKLYKILLNKDDNIHKQLSSKFIDRHQEKIIF